MTEVIDYVDWGDDFRYAEEKRRVTENIRNLAAEKGFTHGTVQEFLIKNRYRTMFGLHVTVHFKKKEWVENDVPKYVPVRIWFTDNCALLERTPNPEWYPEVDGS